MKYEYSQSQVWKSDLAVCINRRAKEGWEYVNFVAVNDSGGVTNEVLILFRRPVA